MICLINYSWLEYNGERHKWEDYIKADSEEAAKKVIEGQCEHMIELGFVLRYEIHSVRGEDSDLCSMRDRDQGEPRSWAVSGVRKTAKKVRD